MPVLLAGAAAQAAAQTDDDDVQSWNELEFALPLSKAAELSLITELRLDQNLRDVSDVRVGGALSLNLGKYFTITPNYLYVPDHSPRGRTNYSHRLRLDGTVKFPLGKLTFGDRSRIERRLLHSRGDSTRYRNRLSAELPLTVAGVGLVPYVSDEVFYDFDEGAWIRNRFAVGVGGKLGGRVSGEVYYLLQNERDSRPGVVHVVGAGLRVSLR